jgi:5-formyltetrahydrofolate cyclo-ligase
MDKTQLRKKYSNLREDLSLEDIEEKSLQIVNKALKLPIWGHSYYHIFLPIVSKKEVNTEYLLHILQGKDKSIVVPKADFASGNMTHILLQENTTIALSNYGISEPISGISIPSKEIDVVFVPLLAYDSYGNRVGYGKGFYDRFLANCNPEAIFVGLSFFEAENKILCENSDIPLHFCVTPKKTYSF